jgi:hypothetical protein
LSGTLFKSNQYLAAFAIVITYGLLLTTIYNYP